MKTFFSFLAITLSMSLFAQDRYAVQMKSGSFLFGNNTSYIQTVAGSSQNSISTQNALEINETGNIYTRNGNELYFMHFGQSRISKYIMSSNGDLVFNDLIQFPDGPSNPHVVDLLFKENNTAYVLCYGVWTVFEIDLNTMTIIDQIDLNELNKPEEESSTLEEMIIRDGKLFVGIWYGSGLVENTPIEGAYMAVIDVATNSYEKLITDDRTYLLGYGSSAVDQMFVDEKGDLYVSGTDIISGGQQIQQGGILRIKKGETEFDKDYFVNLDKATGDKITIGLEYIGNGIAYTAAQFQEEVNNFDPFSKYFDATFKYYKVNIYTGETELLEGTPFTKGFFYTWLTPVGDKYLLPIGGPNNDNGIWLLDASSNTAEKITNLDAEPFGMFRMKGVPGSVGITENEFFSELSVYPNPVKDKMVFGFTYNGNKSSLQFSVRDLQGRVVKTYTEFVKPQAANTIVFDFSEFKSGSYLLDCSDLSKALSIIIE